MHHLQKGFKKLLEIHRLLYCRKKRDPTIVKQAELYKRSISQSDTNEITIDTDWTLRRRNEWIISNLYKFQNYKTIEKKVVRIYVL